MVWHYATDITDLEKAFAHEKQVDRDILTDVICGRTNTQLKLLQDKFAEISGDEKDQPTALIDFLTTKIENLVDRNKDDIVKFVSRVLEDPYLRTDPAERDDSQDQDDKKAESDARKLKKGKFEAVIFLKVFLTREGSPNLNFSQIKAISDAFGDDPSLEDKVMDNFTGSFQTLCLKYIKFALE